MNAKLLLKRNQLAAFLKDPDAIRAFEELFAVADNLKDTDYFSGANGKYLKMGNGIVQCWGNKVASDGDAITFPIAFVEVPDYVGTNGRASAGEYNFCQPTSVTMTGFVLTYKTAAGAAVAARGFNWTAIGRWK